MGKKPVLVITSSPELSNKIQLILDESGGFNGMLISNPSAEFIFGQSTDSRICILDSLPPSVYTQFPIRATKKPPGHFWKAGFLTSGEKQTIQSHLVYKNINDAHDR